MDRYGLFGRDIGYSFSRNYFRAKFENENITAQYENFDCLDIHEVESFLKDTTIRGYNVTIPYKQEIIPFLDELDPHAEAIGAVNTIKRLSSGKLKGFNTDFIGFKNSLLESYTELLFDPASAKAKKPLHALILGTGGASKAIAYTLELMGIDYQYVSRKRKDNRWTYADLDEEIINQYLLIINCTPLGTYPDIDQFPDIPYPYLGIQHIAYDLIYNPPESVFLRRAKEQKADTINGLRMLELQAEASWAIWSQS